MNHQPLTVARQIFVTAVRRSSHSSDRRCRLAARWRTDEGSLRWLVITRARKCTMIRQHYHL